MDPQVPIAIVGMSCRFAGDVTDPERLWQLCADGRSAWSKIPSSRFNLGGVFHPNGEKSNTVRTESGQLAERHNHALTGPAADERPRRPLLD